MKKVTELVKSKKVVVGSVEVEVFDSIAEAIGFLGDATVLELVNTQHSTNLRNRLRASKSGTPSKKALEKLAMARVSVEEFQGVVGDEVAMQRLIDSKVAEIKVEMEAARLANPPAEDEDEDEDDK